MSIKHRCWGYGLAVAVLVCLSATPRALAQANPRVRIPAMKPKVQERFVFEFRDAPWHGPGGVLEWLVEKTRLPVISTHKPTGTFTFNPPRGANGTPQRYTIPEIIDILNETLAKQERILLRKIASITILATDQPLPESGLERLTTEEELAERGKTELASIRLRLTSLDAEAFAREAKDLLGPGGRVTALPSTNMLILRGRVGALRLTVKTIKEFDADAGRGPTTFAYKCVYIKASDAAEKLTRFLVPPAQEKEISARKAGNRDPCIRATRVTVDDQINTLMISGSSGTIYRTKMLLAQIDQGQ